MRLRLAHLSIAIALPAATFLAFVAVPISTLADDVCYADGTSYPLGAQACLGGWVNVCTDIGWALLGDGTSC
jgi:hypothetical protein